MTVRRQRFYKKKVDRIIYGIDKSNSTRDRKIRKELSKIRIKIINDPIKSSINWYIKENNCSSKHNYDYFIKNKQFAIRIFLNHIRHNHSNYIKLITRLKIMNSCEEIKFREEVNKIILRIYKGLI